MADDEQKTVTITDNEGNDVEVPAGLDGENPVSPNNPPAKAVAEAERDEAVEKRQAEVKEAEAVAEAAGAGAEAAGTNKEPAESVTTKKPANRK